MACGKSDTLDDNLIEAVEVPKAKKGRQEDGTYITSTGKVLPAKNRTKRDPYPEPEEAQVDGHRVVCQSVDGKIGFEAERMTVAEWRKLGAPERKRQPLMYRVIEVYTKNKPRDLYSWDEMEQVKRGELKK